MSCLENSFINKTKNYLKNQLGMNLTNNSKSREFSTMKMKQGKLNNFN